VMWEWKWWLGRGAGGGANRMGGVGARRRLSRRRAGAGRWTSGEGAADGGQGQCSRNTMTAREGQGLLGCQASRPAGRRRKS